MASKRTAKEIEADVKKIQEAAKTATSIKMIAEMTGITVRKIGTSLEGHAIIKKRIFDSIAQNLSKAKDEAAKAKAEAKKAKSKSDCDTKPTMVRYPVKEENLNAITICDAPALINGLQACFTTPIVIPSYVYDTLIGVSKTNCPDSLKAKNALLAIEHTDGWCTIAKKVEHEILLVDPDEKPGWREKALVALACKYWCEGYQVTIKTRTGYIARLARLQKCFTVDFVKADNEDYILKVVS